MRPEWSYWRSSSFYATCFAIHWINCQKHQILPCVCVCAFVGLRAACSTSGAATRKRRSPWPAGFSAFDHAPTLNDGHLDTCWDMRQWVKSCDMLMLSSWSRNSRHCGMQFCCTKRPCIWEQQILFNPSIVQSSFISNWIPYTIWLFHIAMVNHL